MSWETFKQNILRLAQNPESINDIEVVATAYATEYDEAIKRGKDNLFQAKFKMGNSGSLKDLFKSALEKGNSQTEPYDLVGEMGKGVLSYWQGAQLDPTSIQNPPQTPPAVGAVQNIQIVSMTCTNAGVWQQPILGEEPDDRNENEKNDDMPEVEIGETEEILGEVPIDDEAEETEIVEEVVVDLYPAEEVQIGELKEETVEEQPPLSEFDAILVGGLDYRDGDYSIDKQVELFKEGFGQNKKVKGFRYTTTSAEVIVGMKNSPKVPVFLFSAGCVRALELSNSDIVDKSKLFIIEPYTASENTKKIILDAIANGVPISNVYVGPDDARGSSISGASKTPSGISHWGSLTYVGREKANLVTTERKPTKVSEGGDPPKIAKNVGAQAPAPPPGLASYGNGKVPKDKLGSIDSSYGGGTLHIEAAKMYNKLIARAKKDGIKWRVSSTYRDYSSQVACYEKYGPGSAAKPGSSPHGWGLALDFGEICGMQETKAKALGVGRAKPAPAKYTRENSKIYQWLAKNAPNYGWYNPYRLADNAGMDEAWHWEYWGFYTLTKEQRQA